jgi:hypothetical protein
MGRVGVCVDSGFFRGRGARATWFLVLPMLGLSASRGEGIVVGSLAGIQLANEMTPRRGQPEDHQ